VVNRLRYSTGPCLLQPADNRWTGGPLVRPGVRPRRRPRRSRRALGRRRGQHRSYPADPSYPCVPVPPEPPATGPHGGCPAFPRAIRPRRPRRDVDDPHALAGGDVIERAGELAVPVPDEEAGETDPPGEVRDQVAGLPGGPCTVRVALAPRMCTRRIAASTRASTYSRLRKPVSAVRKSRRQVLGLGAQERPPGGVQAARSGPVPPGAEDPLAGRLAHLVAKAVSSPCTRRYPRARFSSASRRTRSRISWLAAGRPGGSG